MEIGQKNDNVKEEVEKLLLKNSGDILLSSGLSIILYARIKGLESLEWIHPYFRQIVKNIPYYPEFESPVILNILQRYAIKYLVYAEGNNQDLLALKSLLDRLVRTNNPALFLEALKLSIRLGDLERLKMMAKGCFRFLGSLSELKYPFLCYIKLLSKKLPGVFSEKYSMFFPFSIEK